MPHRWTFVLSGLLLILNPIRAQDEAPPPDFSPLDQLCAPIALYPDPLITLMLPASAFPDQIQAAASGAAPAFGWDASVIGLSHYPSVLQWMASNPDWTSQLGGAFAGDPASVMDAIQDLRHRAQASGILVSTPQQQVIADETGAIEIVPAQPNVIYAPEYDPELVFWGHRGGGYQTYISWGNPYPAGDWLSFDFDWHSHRVWTGNWYGYRMAHGGWGHPINHAQVSGGNYRGWHAPSHPPARPAFATSHGIFGHTGGRPAVAQPHPRDGAPHPVGPAQHPVGPAQHPVGPAPHQGGPEHRPTNVPPHQAQVGPTHAPVQASHPVVHEAPRQHAPAQPIHTAPQPPVTHQPVQAHAAPHDPGHVGPEGHAGAHPAAPAKKPAPKKPAPRPTPPPQPPQQDGHQNP